VVEAKAWRVACAGLWGKWVGGQRFRSVIEGLSRHESIEMLVSIYSIRLKRYILSLAFFFWVPCSLKYHRHMVHQWLSEFVTQYWFSMSYSSRDIWSLIAILLFWMFPDPGNNLKSNGSSLYKYSVSYSTLKHSFASRILTITGGHP